MHILQKVADPKRGTEGLEKHLLAVRSGAILLTKLAQTVWTNTICPGLSN
jgi:hypothetical protein